jgi:hypothetical protein
MTMSEKEMNNVIVDVGYNDLTLSFLSGENKLSSLDDVTIAQPRISNEIH